MSALQHDHGVGAPWRRLLNPFDLVVLSGAAVNLVVVAYLVAYWLLHG